jgi:hypothetical protein
MGTAEVEITRVELVNAGGQPRTCFRQVNRRDPDCAARSRARFRFRVRRRHLQRRRHVLLRTNTNIEGGASERLEGTAKRDSSSRAWTRGRTYKLDVASIGRTGVPYDLPPPALHLPRDIEAVRRGHLPAASSVALLGGVHLSGLAAPRAGSLREMKSGHARPLRPVEAAALAAGCGPPAAGLVFTNGVFEPPAIRGMSGLCADARALSGRLIVGVNSIGPLRANKGPRPPAQVRCWSGPKVLLALDPVDAVVVFDEDTPHAVILPRSARRARDGRGLAGGHLRRPATWSEARGGRVSGG